MGKDATYQPIHEGNLIVHTSVDDLSPKFPCLISLKFAHEIWPQF